MNATATDRAELLLNCQALDASTFVYSDHAIVQDFIDAHAEKALLALASAELDTRTADLDEKQTGRESRRTLRLGYGIHGRWRGPLPGWLIELRWHVETMLTDILETAEPLHFDGAAIYDYAAGSRRGAHIDERCFVGPVAIVTLGGSALVTLRDLDGQRPRSFVASPRSLYCMHGEGVTNATHEVECNEPRIALAFRRVDPRVAVGGPMEIPK